MEKRTTASVDSPLHRPFSQQQAGRGHCAEAARQPAAAPRTRWTGRARARAAGLPSADAEEVGGDGGERGVRGEEGGEVPALPPQARHDDRRRRGAGREGALCVRRAGLRALLEEEEDVPARRAANRIIWPVRVGNGGWK